METSAVIIVIALAMVLINILDSLFDSLPLPLIQLAVGCVLGLTVIESALKLEPEFFMAIVIAPLLFRESEETDIMSMWRVRKQVFLMAFLLVFITVGVIGLAVHLLMPALPPAACFALGAVLGPTDYVAVASLSSKVKLPGIVVTVLKGEALINDASGLISLRFAVAALLTGTFSILDASFRLVILCVGGFLVGWVLMFAKRVLTEQLRRRMVHYADTYLLVELLMPFLSYVVAETCGVSGILAAVTAGTMQALDFKKTGLFEAELAIAKQNMWEIVCFVLNAIVFIMLGMQIPKTILQIWTNAEYDKGYLVAVTILTTLILIAVRFMSLIFLAKEVIGDTIKEKLRNTLLLTLAGVKGVVSMAAAISLPFMLTGSAFEERPVIMFIATGTITLTLLLALFLLPRINKREDASGWRNENKAQTELLREVVRQLRKKEGEHLGAVIVGYQKRIRELEHAGYEKNQLKQLRALRRFADGVELSALTRKYKKHEINRRTFRAYRDILSMMRHLESGGMLTYTMAILKQRVTRLIRPDRHVPTGETAEEYRQLLRDLFWEQTDVVVKAVERQQHLYAEELIAGLVEERINLMGQLIDDTYAGTLRARLQQEYIDELLIGYEIERETIWDFLDEGKLTLSQANELRNNVNKLETYTLAEDRHDVMLKLMGIAREKNAEQGDGSDKRSTH